MFNTCRIVILVSLLLGLPLLAAADGRDEQERNRKLLAKAKTDPEHYARLIQDLQAFLALPTEKQESLRKLDRDLHDESSATYGRLQRALERYNDWLQRLPQADRTKLESTTDTKERLQLIREIRDRQWVSRLPRAYQEELVKLASDPARYSQRVKELREEERQRRKEWSFTAQDGEATKQLLARLQKLKPEISEFVRESLVPTMTDAEKQRLQDELVTAEKTGRWIPYFTTLVELADKHPIRHPPSSFVGPRRFSELPSALQARLQKQAGWPSEPARQAEGRWPAYALAVARFTNENRIPRPEKLGPSQLSDFSKKVQDFCKDTLFPVLDEADTKILGNAENRWPFYPNQLVRLAQKHKLRLPGMTLPGGPELWSPFRNRARANAELADASRPRAAQELPDVSDRTLLDFMEKELSPEQQLELPSVLLSDPQAREQIKRQFFQRNPDVLERLQKADLNKQLKKKTPKK